MSPTKPKSWLGDPLSLIGLLLGTFPLSLGVLWFNGALGELWPMVVVADGLMLAFAPFTWQFAKAQVTIAVDPANLLVHWHDRAEEWQAYRAGEIGRHPVDWADTRSAAKSTSCAKSTCFRRRPFD